MRCPSPTAAPAARLLGGLAVLTFAACTSAPERSTPTTVPAATTTFATLPAVGVFTYPTGAEQIVAQISADAGVAVPIPLLTVYGDGMVVAAVGEEWLTGRATDLEIQDLLDDARGVGLLDDDLVLRGVVVDEQPDITVSIDVDGRQLRHELDLARIERPIALRAFLLRAATANVFELTESFDPGSWLNCTGDVCALADEPDGAIARPVLSHEDAEALATAANPAGS